jgi:hypothetical protein
MIFSLRYRTPLPDHAQALHPYRNALFQVLRMINRPSEFGRNADAMTALFVNQRGTKGWNIEIIEDSIMTDAYNRIA